MALELFNNFSGLRQAILNATFFFPVAHILKWSIDIIIDWDVITPELWEKLTY